MKIRKSNAIKQFLLVLAVLELFEQITTELWKPFYSKLYI